MMAQNPLAQADADDIGMGEAMARMMAEMPLRALLSFGGDSVPAGAGEMLLKQLNAYIKFINHRQHRRNLSAALP